MWVLEAVRLICFVSGVECVISILVTMLGRVMPSACLHHLSNCRVFPCASLTYHQIMPEVAATEAAERATREAERIRLAKLMAEGKGPKLPAVLDEDSDEEVPDVEIQVPTSRVKLIVGPGGAKIKEIQKKSS